MLLWKVLINVLELWKHLTPIYVPCIRELHHRFNRILLKTCWSAANEIFISLYCARLKYSACIERWDYFREILLKSEKHINIIGDDSMRK